jgi:hypothetical protein
MKTTIITLSALLLIGCGSRKVETSKETVKEEVTQTVKTETKTDTNETVKVLDTSTVDEIEFVPIDTTKPIIYNGQKVFNAKIRHSKRKNDITTVSSKKVSQIERKEVKTKAKREVKVKDKVTEAKRGFPWWILLVIGALYLAYRKVKSMNVI